jgi:hypothetical protein
MYMQLHTIVTPGDMFELAVSGHVSLHVGRDR